MLRFRQAAALGALIAASALAVAAQAQPANPLRQLALTSEDFAIVSELVNGLYKAGRTGATETWSNPQSGNSGRVTVIETFEYQGLPCRTVEHTVKVRRHADPKQVVLKTCRDTDGVWKLI